MNLQTILMVGFGSALGGMARFAMTWWATTWIGTFRGHVLATLAINIIGSFAIGFASNFLDREVVKHFVMVGVLGGFTTFSAFSYQTVILLQDHRTGVAAVYVLASVVACVAGAWLGCMASTALRPGA